MFKRRAAGIVARRGCTSNVSRQARCNSSSLLVPSADDPDDYAFGIFDVILPVEPYVWGTSHITPRNVPAWIPRPHYATLPPQIQPSSGRIDLKNTEELTKLRSATELAKKIREHAGTLVKVGGNEDLICKHLKS